MKKTFTNNTQLQHQPQVQPPHPLVAKIHIIILYIKSVLAIRVMAKARMALVRPTLQFALKHMAKIHGIILPINFVTTVVPVTNLLEESAYRLKHQRPLYPQHPYLYPRQLPHQDQQLHQLILLS